MATPFDLWAHVLEAGRISQDVFGPAVARLLEKAQNKVPGVQCWRAPLLIRQPPPARPAAHWMDELSFVREHQLRVGVPPRAERCLRDTACQALSLSACQSPIPGFGTGVHTGQSACATMAFSVRDAWASGPSSLLSIAVAGDGEG